MKAGTAAQVTARVRGGAVAGTTVALSVAAHGAAGGGYPTGATALLLVGVAVVLASLPAASPGSRRGVAALAGLLVSGQVLGHLTLSIGLHHPVTVSAPMATTHVIAVLACAALIAAAERLGPAVAAALRSVVASRLAEPAAPGPAPSGHVRPVVRTLAAILCRSCLPRRGPPALV